MHSQPDVRAEIFTLWAYKAPGNFSRIGAAL